MVCQYKPEGHLSEVEQAQWQKLAMGHNNDDNVHDVSGYIYEKCFFFVTVFAMLMSFSVITPLSNRLWTIAKHEHTVYRLFLSTGLGLV